MRSTTLRVTVPDACRKWARASGVPLHALLQRFVDLGTAVLEVVPLGSGVPPTVPQLLSAVSVAAPDSTARTAPSDALSDEFRAPVLMPSSELAALRSGDAIESCPVVFARLRSYAAACHLIHTRRDVAYLVYLVPATPFRSACPVALPTLSRAAPSHPLACCPSLRDLPAAVS